MKRTTMRSSLGKKLYAVRNKNGQFKDIQTYKRAHAGDLQHTAKGEKRQRLMSYITDFASRLDCCHEKERYNSAWDKLWAKIDKLKLFMLITIVMSLAGTTQAGYFKTIDINHPQTSVGAFGDYKGHYDGGGVLALVTVEQGRLFDAWVPVAIGGSMGKALGGPSVAIGTGYNLVPATKAVLWCVLEALTKLDNTKFPNVKNLLAAPTLGSPDATVFVGPTYSLVVTSFSHAKMIPTWFLGAELRW